MFIQKNIVLRKDLLPLPQKGLLGKCVASYCPSIPLGCPLCHETWDLPLRVPLRAAASQAARVPAMRSPHHSQGLLSAPGQACMLAPHTPGPRVWSHRPAEEGQSRRGHFRATTVCTCKELSSSGVEPYWTKTPKSMCGCCRRGRRAAGGQVSPRLLPLIPVQALLTAGWEDLFRWLF